MKCDYCEHEPLEPRSGLLNSSPDSPEMDFWYCPGCHHTHMDEDQQRELTEKLNSKR